MYDLTIEEYTYFNNYLRGLENHHKHNVEEMSIANRYKICIEIETVKELLKIKN